MDRTVFVITLIGLLLAPRAWSETVERIAFGSCANQNKPQPIWAAVNDFDPDVFVFLGDNVYADTKDPKVFREKYQRLAEKPGFQALREKALVLATWDDHDYGQNDAGAEFSQKEISRQIMLDFWGEPADSERRTRESGLYTSVVLGEPGRRVQIILLDLRWNRTPLKHVTAAVYDSEKKPQSMGPYLAVDDKGELLGEAQWAWLETQLRQPAELRLIGTSIQLLAEFTGWESWANFPHERQRFFDLLRGTEANGVVLISGDTHWSEVSKVDGVIEYPLWEFTSSGLNQEWHRVSPNNHRVGTPYVGAAFGALEIDWASQPTTVTFRVVTDYGDIKNKNTLFINSLRAGAGKVSQKRHKSVMATP